MTNEQQRLAEGLYYQLNEISKQVEGEDLPYWIKNYIVGYFSLEVFKE